MSAESKAPPAAGQEAEEEEPLTYQELMTRKGELESPAVIFSARNWLDLIDKFVLVAEEEEASDRILDPAMEMCQSLIGRGAKVSQATLRLSRCHFLKGEYTQSRKLLEELEGDLRDASREDAFLAEVEAFRSRLDVRTQRDGKIGLMILTAIAAGIGFFWVRRRKQAAEAASLPPSSDK